MSGHTRAPVSNHGNGFWLLQHSNCRC